ncbi:phage head morphogenesis protein [Ectopseudomonas oleovorans]|uniref:phage head morphogenesis protein n=1 Tax=Ectopseudomonas oleovorans TaxID=301 RepID=UPI003F1C0199
MFQEEHAAAWTVMTMRLDILEAIRAAVDEAIEGGMTFAAFKRDLQPLLEKLGWWGRGELLDPLTGETREVQLGSPRRLKTCIYDVNLRQAHAAGPVGAYRARDQDAPILAVRPRLARHRPEHVGWWHLLRR